MSYEMDNLPPPALKLTLLQIMILGAGYLHKDGDKGQTFGFSAADADDFVNRLSILPA
jgi:hypothetical protein